MQTDTAPRSVWQTLPPPPLSNLSVWQINEVR